jgi:hypothetical protein
MSLIIKYLKFDIFSEGLRFRAKFSSWVSLLCVSLCGVINRKTARGMEGKHFANKFSDGEMEFLYA